MKTHIALLAACLTLSAGPGHAQWIQTSGPSGPQGNTTQSLVANETDVFAGLDDGVYHSADLGGHWNIISRTFSYPRCLMLEGKTLYVGSEDGVFSTSDLGASWSHSTVGLKNFDTRALVFIGDKLLAGISPGGLFISSDSGKTWADANGGIQNEAIISLSSLGSIVVAGNVSKGKILVSTDTGKTWTARVGTGIPQNESIRDLLVVDKEIYAACGGGVYKSIDSGKNWMRASTGLSHPFSEALVAHGNDLFVGLQDGGVYLSSDGGARWHDVSTDLSESLIYSLADTKDFLFAGGGGTGVWRRPYSEMLLSSAVKVLVKPSVRLSNFPNPFSRSTMIELALRERQTISVSVTDLDVK